MVAGVAPLRDAGDLSLIEQARSNLGPLRRDATREEQLERVAAVDREVARLARLERWHAER